MSQANVYGEAAQFRPRSVKGKGGRLSVEVDGRTDAPGARLLRDHDELLLGFGRKGTQ